MAFDVETAGELQEYALQPFRARTGEAWLTSYAVTTLVKGEPRSVSVPIPPDPLRRAAHAHKLGKMLTQCAADGVRLVGWNMVFDMAWLIALGLREEVYACEWLDAMLLYRHLTAEPKLAGQRPRSYRLKDTVAEFYPDEAGYEEGIDFQATDPESVRRRLIYNAKDTEFTLRFARKFLAQMTPAQENAALIEAACLPLVAESVVEGIAADRDAAAALSQSLDETAAVRFFELKMAGGADVTKEVLASPKQLAELLYDKWGLPVLKMTAPTATNPTGSRSTDKDALDLLASRDPRAKQLHEYKEARNNRTKFADAVITSLDYNGDGRVRPAPRVYGTYTGRLTYASKQGKGKAERPTGIALHQWKRGAEYRSQLRAPDGYKLVEWDFAGQEFRWMAVLSRDPVMLRLCAPGEDAHAFMGGNIGNVPYTEMLARKETDKAIKHLRQLGKVGNLSCIAAGQQVLTDRGYVSIEDVTIQDQLWDGRTWVSHDGVVYQGERHVIAYCGITATVDHKVLVGGEWVDFGEAASLGRCIEPALGTGWARATWAAFRIMGGVVRRAVHEARRAVRRGAVRMRPGQGCQPAHDGAGALDHVQGLCVSGTAFRPGPADRYQQGYTAAAEARQRHASALHEPVRPVMAQLRRTWDRVSVSLRACLRGIHTATHAAGGLCRGGYRPGEQRRALRAGEPADRHAQGELGQPTAVYDILNAGPRHRFTVNGRIVSNCQYRTSANTLRDVARVQYQVILSDTEAQALWATYQTTYRQVPVYWRTQIYKARRDGFVETMAGRRVFIGTGDQWDKSTRWSRESTAINFPIQGTGAEQKYLALKVARDWLPKYDGRFYYELHDGLFFVFPERYAQKAMEEGKELLSNLPYKQAWGVTLPIQFPVDAKIGDSWGTLKG